MIKRILNRITISLVFSFILFLQFVIIMIIAGIITYLAISSGIISAPKLADILVVIFIACMIVDVVFMLVAGPRMFKPFQKIIDSIEQLAKGDFSVRLNIHYPRGLKGLSDSFNRMAQELSGIEMLRTDFINNFSHEFKTPIVSIKGFAEMLKYADLTPEERSEYLDIVINESSRLAVLATNVLNLSKIETQTLLTETDRFNLGEQIRQCVLLSDMKIEKKNIVLNVDIKDIFYNGNKDLLNQVWLNLIDNAIKFTPDGGQISISASQTDSESQIIIKDTGCGIEAAAMDYIFDKFYQADTSHAMMGNGIGLTVVKKIVELHRGKILCESEVNKGTTFTVLLPLN